MSGLDGITRNDSLQSHWGSVVKKTAVSDEMLKITESITGARFLATSFRHPFCTYYLRGRRLAPPEAFSISAIDDLLDCGATAVMLEAHEYFPEFSLVKHLVDRELGTSCGITGFYTPTGSDGLSWHRDKPHVCAVQVEGHKSWDIEPTPPDGPWAVGPVPGVGWEPAAYTRISMAPGDLLYAPPGVAHKAAAGRGSASFHFSIIFPPSLAVAARP